MNSDITITGSVATWKMPPMQGDLGGTYTGTFEFKCYLDALSMVQAGKEYRAMLGEMSHQASNIESDIAFALTQLRQRIISAPPFWTSPTQQANSMAGNIGDLSVIAAVLDASLRAEAQFKENIQKERDEVLDRAIKSGEELLQKQQKGEE